jgi:hypothetical protein
MKINSPEKTPIGQKASAMKDTDLVVDEIMENRNAKRMRSL